MAPKPRPNKDEEQILVLGLIAQGQPIKRIAREIGIPRSTIRRWWREHEARRLDTEDGHDVLDFRNRTSSVITSPVLALAISAPWRQQ